MKKNLFLGMSLLAIAGLWTGCSNDEEADYSPQLQGKAISFGVQGGTPQVVTKVTGTTAEYVDAFVVSGSDNIVPIGVEGVYGGGKSTLFWNFSIARTAAGNYDYNPKRYYDQKATGATFFAYSPVSNYVKHSSKAGANVDNLFGGDGAQIPSGIVTGSADDLKAPFDAVAFVPTSITDMPTKTATFNYQVQMPNPNGNTSQEDLLVAWTDMETAPSISGKENVSLNFVHALSRVFVTGQNMTTTPVRIKNLQFVNLYNNGQVWVTGSTADIAKGSTDELVIWKTTDERVPNGDEKEGTYRYVLPESGVYLEAANEHGIAPDIDDAKWLVSKEQGMMVIPQVLIGDPTVNAAAVDANAASIVNAAAVTVNAGYKTTSAISDANTAAGNAETALGIVASTTDSGTAYGYTLKALTAVNGAADDGAANAAAVQFKADMATSTLAVKINTLIDKIAAVNAAANNVCTVTKTLTALTPIDGNDANDNISLTALEESMTDAADISKKLVADLALLAKYVDNVTKASNKANTLFAIGSSSNVATDATIYGILKKITDDIDAAEVDLAAVNTALTDGTTGVIVKAKGAASDATAVAKKVTLADINTAATAVAAATAEAAPTDYLDTAAAATKKANQALVEAYDEPTDGKIFALRVDYDLANTSQTRYIKLGQNFAIYPNMQYLINLIIEGREISFDVKVAEFGDPTQVEWTNPQYPVNPIP